jgi:hypothetical protein
MQTQKKSREDSLLSALGAVPISSANSAKAEQASVAVVEPATAQATQPSKSTASVVELGAKAKAKAGKSGKGIHFYFTEQDTARIRVLAAFLSAQGVRVNDSLIVKTALRVAEPNNALLAACQEAQKADRRRK